ncbi:MAG: thiosulfate oxidation carrier protein SoxY [Sedimenticola sp.]|nr:thiosulfate oxidation carrier protein SoxY [Sedimenticola sp.]
MNYNRREFVETLAIGSGGALLAMTGLNVANAVELPAANGRFAGKNVDEVLNALGAQSASKSADIAIKAPEIASNGSMVSVTVTSNLPGTEYIALIAENNPHPLVAEYYYSKRIQPYVSTRIKMAKTSNVRAVVKAGGKFFYASREVKVTIGGCGG